ncbi:MAG: hypothetical protein ABJC04_08655, partial [Verrucomicrobiota bacterium]
MKTFLLFLPVMLFLQQFSGAAETNKVVIRQMVRAVAAADGELSGIPFKDIVEATTGKKILPFDLKEEADRELLSKIGLAMDEVIRRLNATNSVAQKQKRINEVSSHFENEM